MKESEKISANKLKSFLEKKGHTAFFEGGDNPPDINFYVDNKMWAVEHTRLFQYSRGDKRELSRLDVDKPIQYFEENINKNLKDKFKNKWIIAIKGPLNKKILMQVEKDVIAIIQKENNENPFQYSTNLYSIEKLIYKCPEIVVYSTLSANSKIPDSQVTTSDIQEQVNYAIDRILKLKRPIFQKMLTFDKCILLIENQYMFTTVEKVKNRLFFYPDLHKEIDSVYLINYEDVHLIY